MRRRSSMAAPYTLAFSLAFGLLAVLAWQGQQIQQRLVEANRSIYVTLDRITATQAILSSLQDIETGERGFVITGIPSYLEPYQRGRERLDDEQRRLEVLLAPLIDQRREWLATLNDAIDKRIEIADTNIRRRQEQGLDAAAEQLPRSGGKQVMDHLRAHLHELQESEHQRLTAKNAKLAQRLESSREQTLTGYLLVIVLFWSSFLAIRRNIAMRKQVSIKARAGEARMRALLQAVPDQLFEIDAAGHVQALTSTSPSAAGLPDVLRERISGSDTKGDLQSAEWQDENGNDYEIRLAPAGDGTHLAIIRNVTETHRARRRLRDQQAFLRNVIDADENLIFVRSADGRFLLCNQAFSDLLALRPLEVEGRMPSDLPGIVQLNRLLADDQILLDGERSELRIGDINVRDAQGRERWLQLLKRPLQLSDDSKLILAVAVDLSDRRRVEQMKGEFISTVSHELRTPLTSIRSALSMLSSGMAGDISNEQRPLLDIANKNSERLVLLINDILDMEKLESGRLEFRWTISELQPLLQQALESNGPYAREYGVHLALEIKDDGPVRLDQDRFAQIMANLLSNAIKHSPADGLVSVRLSRYGNHLEVAVADQGQGIPEDFRERVFERFAQADSSDRRKRGGTGLGLAITRSLVEHLGGEIGFESDIGKGTCFFVRLPMVQQPTPAVPAASSLQRPRVLVLESDAAAASSLADLLEQQGYSALVASSAAQADDLLSATSVHALTLGPHLADEDGIAFLRRLRQQPAYRHLPVLMVSLQEALDEHTRTAALQGGAVGIVDWLRLPLDKARLQTAIQACMTDDRRPHILHIEDDVDLRQLVARLLADNDVHIHCAGSLEQAREQLSRRHHALAILDLGLPDGNGAELLSELSAASPPTPVIIYSARDAENINNTLVLGQLIKSRHESAELAGLINEHLRHWPPAPTGPMQEDTP